MKGLLLESLAKLAELYLTYCHCLLNVHLLNYSPAFLYANTRSSECCCLPACTWDSSSASTITTNRGFSLHTSPWRTNYCTEQHVLSPAPSCPSSGHRDTPGRPLACTGGPWAVNGCCSDLLLLKGEGNSCLRLYSCFKEALAIPALSQKARYFIREGLQRKHYFPKCVHHSKSFKQKSPSYCSYYS